MNPAYTYGWGLTGPNNNCDYLPCPSSTILQETELRICNAAESDNEGLVDSQLCAVGATSAPYLVIIHLHQDSKCYLHHCSLTKVAP